jgi:DNA-binding beta-propeller fold protein YncE/mono/diheme cytochrome c family protein
MSRRANLRGALILGLVALTGTVVGAQQPVSYSNDIRPIIQRSCQGCHQPASKMGGLVLTEYEGIKAGGQKHGAAFKEGSPEESPLLAYLTGKNEPRMPMGQDPLPENEIELFRRWISEGAKNDAPASAAGPQVPSEPPVYRQSPVITGMAYSPDGSLLAVGGYREIILQKADGSGIAARLLGKSDRIHSIEFTADGKHLVAVGGTPARFGEIQVWDVESRKLLQSFVSTNDTFFGGAVSPDGSRVVVGSPDKTVRVVNLSTGQELFKAGHHEDWVLDAVFGIDGKRVVSVGRDRAAKLADAENGAFTENVNFLREGLYAIARHPRRDYVLIGGEDRVPYLYMMDRPRALKIADDSTLVRKFEAQEGPIMALAFSPDGSRIAVGGISGKVPVYDTDSGKLVATCEGNGAGIYVIAFRPDGQHLAAAGFDGRVRLFEPGTGKLIKEFAPVPLEPEAASE